MDYSQAGTYRRPESEGPVLAICLTLPTPRLQRIVWKKGALLVFIKRDEPLDVGQNAPQNQVSHPQRRYAPRSADLDSPSGRCVKLGARFHGELNTSFVVVFGLQERSPVDFHRLFVFHDIRGFGRHDDLYPTLLPECRHAAGQARRIFDTAELVKAVALFHEQDQNSSRRHHCPPRLMNVMSTYLCPAFAAALVCCL